MLAIPLHSQSTSMADEIVPKKLKRNQRLGFALDSPHTTSTLGFISPRILRINALWNKAIGEIYGRDGGLSTPNGLGIKNGVWDNIRSIGYTMDQLGVSFSSSFRSLVGNGDSILFWHDRWLDEGPCLKICFPRLYALDENTNCRLNERLAEIDGSWVLSSAWRSSPRARSCNEINSLYSITESCSLNSGALDGWKSTLGSGKDFTAKTLSVMVDSILLEPYHSEQKFKWNSWVS
ncbi:hypothetical protein Tco_1417855 [Tanacetum coccineum]